MKDNGLYIEWRKKIDNFLADGQWHTINEIRFHTGLTGRQACEIFKKTAYEKGPGGMWRMNPIYLKKYVLMCKNIHNAIIKQEEEYANDTSC